MPRADRTVSSSIFGGGGGGGDKATHRVQDMLIERVISRAPFAEQQLILALPVGALRKGVVRRFDPGRYEHAKQHIGSIYIYIYIDTVGRLDS